MTDEHKVYTDEGIEPEIITNGDAGAHNETSPAPSSPLPHMGSFIGWLNSFSDFIKKHGIHGFITTTLMIVIACVVISVFINPQPIMERIQKIQERTHTEKVRERIESDEIIQDYIRQMRLELDADRIMVFETHNGGVSLNGLPFLYVDMSFEDNARGLKPLADEYKNLRISRYPFFSALYRELFWFGAVEELEEIDPSLYYRATEDGDKYIGFIVTYGPELASGAICVVYNEEVTVNPNTIRTVMYKYGSMIGPLLKDYDVIQGQ